MKLRLGTRGSVLARTQSGLVADALVAAARERGLELEVELVTITTSGDTTRGSLVGLSQTGVFVAAVRDAVLAGDCDLAVHSLKDIPTAAHPELEMAAIPQRADARDALCADGRALRDLPHGAAVGTGSPRRSAQLLALRPDLDVQPLRGNVDTRLARVGDDLDGVVLAAAGLSRLDRLGQASELFDTEAMLPAPGQGALALEISPDAPAEWADVVRSLDHGDTRAAVTAERSLLAVLDAGCSAPVGAHGSVERGQLTLRARVIDARGTLALSEVARGPVSEAGALGRSAGWALLGRGAATLMGRN